MQECSVIVWPTILRPDRYQLMDYLHPHMFDMATMVIPKPPVNSLNISALWKPFQPYVYILDTFNFIYSIVSLSSTDLAQSGDLQRPGNICFKRIEESREYETPTRIVCCWHSLFSR